MTELSESAIRVVEFLLKLENWKLITFIEINSVKALKALTGFFRNWGRVASNKNATLTQETNKTNAIQMKNLSRINTNFQSQSSKVPLWKLIPLIRYTYVHGLIKYKYVYWLCMALNLMCVAWNLKTKTGFSPAFTCRPAKELTYFWKKLELKPEHDPNKNFAHIQNEKNLCPWGRKSSI